MPRASEELERRALHTRRTSVPSGSGPSTPRCRCMKLMVLGVSSASRLIDYDGHIYPNVVVREKSMIIEKFLSGFDTRVALPAFLNA